MLFLTYSCKYIKIKTRYEFIVFNSEGFLFPESSVGKESSCNAGDPGLIPGSGRCPQEGTATHFSILGLPMWLRR